MTQIISSAYGIGMVIQPDPPIIRINGDLHVEGRILFELPEGAECAECGGPVGDDYYELIDCRKRDKAGK